MTENGWSEKTPGGRVHNDHSPGAGRVCGNVSQEAPFALVILLQFNYSVYYDVTVLLQPRKVQRNLWWLRVVEESAGGQ